MGAAGVTLLPALLTLHWALAPGFASDGCTGFKHLENGRTFFRYGGLYVTFSCNPGFRIHGYRTSSCVSGHWAREPPLCVAPGCPRPAEIQHGSRVISPDASVVLFTCDSGYRLFGSPLLYCKGKRWNGTMPVCKESDIMSSFQLKQTSFYKPRLELDPNTLPSLKSHFNTIANTASKETFLKSPLLGVPQPKPFLTEDVPKVLWKPTEDQPSKKHWSDKATTQGKGGTEELWETIRGLDVVRKSIKMVDPLAQPLPEATLQDTTTVSTDSLILTRPTGPTILISPAVNDHEAQVPFRLQDQMLSPLPSGENHFTSATHNDHKDPVTPLQVLNVSGKKDLNMVPETANPHVAQINTSTPDNSTLGDTSTRSDEMASELSYNIRTSPQPSPTEDDTLSLTTVTVDGSGVFSPTSLPLSENEPLSSITSHNHFTVSSPPLTTAVIRDGNPPLQGSLATGADEDLFPGTEALTAATQLAPAAHLTRSPDVDARGPYLQPPAKSNTQTERANTDKNSAESVDAHRHLVGRTDEELSDVSKLARIRPAGSHLLELATDRKNRTSVIRTSVISNQSQENSTRNQTVVKLTLDSTARHNLTLITSDTAGFLNRRHRPTCPYPPLPAHGTFYFRTIVNPAPFQYKHYIQYACYPGYTLANGDVYSYCLQEGQWSGVTPMCIEETPCSLNNGGCSQMCQVNEQNRAECHCKPGFLLLEDRCTCRDLDECVEGLHQCQQVCENTFGSYRCSCSSGFQLSADRMSCTDVNECVLPAVRGRCVFGCVNTPGSFHCRCPAGYSVDSTSGHCSDIDECLQNEGRGPCVNMCVNTPGSFHCICPHGYQLAGDGRACISECPPGYRKQRSDSGVGNSTAENCADIDECEEMEQKQQDRCEWKCVNFPGTHHCVCPRGYTKHPGGYRCTDINECALKNGGCSHICMNQRGGYKCSCPQNFRLSPYNRRKCETDPSSQRTVS